jgi:hypothetical protein
MTKAEIILEYFKIFISWPVGVTAISLLFVFKFSNEISAFLKDVCKVKFGQLEVIKQAETPRITQNRKKQKSKTNGITFTTEQINKLDEEFKKLASERDIKDEEIKNKNELINYMIFRSEIYEFSYLNLFLVPNTKMVLLWIQSQNKVIRELLVLYIKSLVNDGLQLEVIINTLVTNELIQMDNGIFQITDKGNRFLEFIKNGK